MSLSQLCTENRSLPWGFTWPNCAQLSSPSAQTCFTCEFYAGKSYPSTNYMHFCGSENVTQKFDFSVLPSSPACWWPEVHGDHPHTSLNLNHLNSVTRSSWTPLHFPPGKTPRQFLCWEQWCYCLFSMKLSEWYRRGQCTPSDSYTNLSCWHILEKVVFCCHENSSELCTF